MTFDEIRNSEKFQTFLISHSLALPNNFKLNGHQQSRIIDTANKTTSVLMTYHDELSARDGKPFVRFYWFNGREPAFFIPSGKQKKLTAAELKKKAEENAKREAWLKEQQIKNARTAHHEYINASVTCKHHPYLQKKGVQAHYGLRYATQTLTETNEDGKMVYRICKGELLIPIISLDKQFMSYQRIREDGKKLLCRNSSKHKGIFPLGRWNKNTTKVVLAEGYATGATLHEATGLTVFVCFDIGNLSVVAQELKDHYPHVEVILASDFDLDKKQAGLITSLLLAQQFGFKFVFPFTVLEGSDWNDLQAESGADAVHHLFFEQLAEYDKQSHADIAAYYHQFLNEENLEKVA